MADIFISYARQDGPVAALLRRAFERRQWTVWSDRDIVSGEPFARVIERQLKAAGAVVVLWSRHAEASSWVYAEAHVAFERGVLVQAKLDDAALPMLYAQLQASDLQRWQGDAADAEFGTLCAGIVRLLKGHSPPGPLEQPLHGIPLREFGAQGSSGLHAYENPALQSSFWTDGQTDEFRRLRLPTTYGFVPKADQAAESFERVENSILIVRDPIRPFEIQIGERRAQRPGGMPGTIALPLGMPVEAFDYMYPFIGGPQHKWLRMVLAELESDSEVLRRIWRDDGDAEVKRVVARNPSAPNEVKKQACIFCDPTFILHRRQFVSHRAVLIHNDFPFGPFFHFLALPEDPVHSWESVSERHLREMNLAILEALDPTTAGGKARLNGSAGIRIGLNSSIRHLVLGKSTRSSAGASVAHVHKQIWGMAPGSLNIGDHLAALCDSYAARGIDYLGRYLDALRRGGFVLWEDEHVALYVPLGQIAADELQIMVKRPNTMSFLELTHPEVASLSRAEFIVTRLYSAMQINSFNEIVLSRSFGRHTANGYRVIVTFITREIDLAVSELSLLYVVDRDFMKTAEVIREKHLPQVLAGLSASS